MLSIALAAGLLLSAVPAEAASLTPTQVQAVTNLLLAFGVDSSTITTVQAALTGTTTTTPATATSTSTSSITGNTLGYLHLGDSGEQVRYLQALLASDPGIYPQGLITGYFGALTQIALARYQAKHGLAPVGFIGPQTRQNLDDDFAHMPLGVSTSSPSGVCSFIPPGHLTAPGWLKHHEGEDQENWLVPGCAYGQNQGTTTPASAPSLAAIAVSGISSSAVTITWTTNVYATGSVSVGTTTSYGTSASQGTGFSMNHSVTVSSLAPSTTYHFLVTSTGVSGKTATSSDMTFTTSAAPDTTPPVLSSISASSIASTSATVSWTTNEPSTSSLYVSTSTPLSFPGATLSYDATLATNHSFTLSPLTASTTYYYIVESADAAGNTATSTEHSFSTL